MERLVLLVVCALCSVVVVLGGGAAAVAVAGSAAGATTTVVAGSPTLRTATGSYDRGQTIEVEGTNWPSSSLVSVELCGNEARNGSIDCDARTARTVATTKDGKLFAQLLATSPPSACPCVVHVFQPQGIIDLAVRVRIDGAPVAPLTEETGPVRSLEVTEARLAGGGGLAAWFGAGPKRTLELTIENTGEVAVDGAAIRAGWGRASSPDQPIEVPDLKPLQPGDHVTVQVPVQMTALSFGRYVAAGSIAGFDGSEFDASTSTYPYGLIVGLLVVVVGAGFLVHRRLAPDESDEAEELDLSTDRDPDSDAAVSVPAASTADSGEAKVPV